jgi:hypothetical protein
MLGFHNNHYNKENDHDESDQDYNKNNDRDHYHDKKTTTDHDHDESDHDHDKKNDYHDKKATTDHDHDESNHNHDKKTSGYMRSWQLSTRGSFMPKVWQPTVPWSEPIRQGRRVRQISQCRFFALRSELQRKRCLPRHLHPVNAQ